MATHPPAAAPDDPALLSQLMARTALGDRAAFQRLYELTSPRLFAVLLRIQRDRGVAEELLQDVYVAAWKAAGGFDAARAQPMTWLTAIARNRAIDSLRRANAQPRTVSTTPLDDDGPADEGMADEAPGPSELLDRAGRARALSACMERLSPSQRQSVALAFFDGLSHAEVADHLRQPLGTVKSWVRRALQTLKSCLDHGLQRDSAGET
jgi:RNA polymerase sigma-70 factor (ECF subfamily)